MSEAGAGRRACSSSRRSSSLPGTEKSSNHSDAERSGSGVRRQTSSSAIVRSSSQAPASATGAATTTRSGSSSRTARTAADVVAPVVIAVVDEDHGAGGELRGRAVAPQRALEPFELAALRRVDRLDPFRRDVERVDDALEQDTRAAARHGAEGEVLVAGDAELAHDEHVERGVERAGDLAGDRHAAARQAEHDHVVAAGVPAQALGQLPARVGAIPEALPFGGHDPAGRPPPRRVHPRPAWTRTPHGLPDGA